MVYSRAQQELGLGPSPALFQCRQRCCVSPRSFVDKYKNNVLSIVESWHISLRTFFVSSLQFGKLHSIKRKISAFTRSTTSCLFLFSTFNPPYPYDFLLPFIYRKPYFKLSHSSGSLLLLLIFLLFKCSKSFADFLDTHIP